MSELQRLAIAVATEESESGLREAFVSATRLAESLSTPSDIAEAQRLKATALIRLGSGPEGFAVLLDGLSSANSQETRDGIVGLMSVHIEAFHELSPADLVQPLEYELGISATAEYITQLSKTLSLDQHISRETTMHFFDRISVECPPDWETQLSKIEAFDGERRRLNSAVVSGDFPERRELLFEYWKDRLDEFKSYHQHLGM